MPALQDLLAKMAPQGQQPGQPPQAPMQQPQAPQGNPLAQLAPQQQAPPQPAPTHAQTVAAVHHFGQIKQAVLPIMDDPNLGKTNVRPKLMDACSKLLASKVMTLPEIMKTVKAFPEEPVDQKNYIDKIYTDNDQAQKMVLQHHANAPPMQGEPEQWSPDNHAQQMAGMLQQYQGQK